MVSRTFGTTTSSSGRSTIDIEYDATGRLKRVSNPSYVAGSTNPATPDAGPWTISGYDHLGRVIWRTTPDGNETSNQNVSRISYAGTLTTVTHQAGQQRRQKTDALGRVMRMDEPDGTGNPGTRTLFSYVGTIFSQVRTLLLVITNT